MTIRDTESEVPCGAAGGEGLAATIDVHDPKLYRLLATGGSLAAAEGYLRGYWDADDLVAAMRILARHADDLKSLERGRVKLLRPLRRGANLLRRNTRAGSRRNVAAHYDLSNEFFAQWLDPTMTYSCGLFESTAATLEQASRAKYELVCRKLRLTPDDQVLEIGCGWGGFAEHAAARHGCRVTATTISREQFEFAQRRVDRAGLSDRVTLLLKDYRDLSGKFDKLASIEMIEAVGERYLATFFGQCATLLKPGGTLVVQAITIPDDRYQAYRRSVDFIRRYVFPGGFLPSLSAIGHALQSAPGLRMTHLESFAPDYAQTLLHWRENFHARIGDVRRLGFDDRFCRLWHYYLCYCEAGFRERQVELCQMRFEKRG